MAIPSKQRGQEAEPSGSSIPQVGQETDMAELAFDRLWSVDSLAAGDESADAESSHSPAASFVGSAVHYTLFEVVLRGFVDKLAKFVESRLGSHWVSLRQLLPC